LKKIIANIWNFRKAKRNADSHIKVFFRDEYFGATKEEQFQTILQLPNQRSLLEVSLKTANDFEKYFNLKHDEFETYSKKMQPEFAKDLYNYARQFIIEMIVRMKEIIPFKNEVLESVDVIKLEGINESKWTTLAKQFTNIVPSNEFNAFKNQLDIFAWNFPELKSYFNSSNQNLINFWTSNKIIDYPILKKLALACLTLPYSTVSVERSFSILRDIQRPKRNNLSAEAVEACLLSHHSLNASESFLITNDMKKKYKVMWNSLQSALNIELSQEPSNQIEEKKEETQIQSCIKELSEGLFENDELEENLNEINYEFNNAEIRKRHSIVPLLQQIKDSKKIKLPPKDLS